VWGGRECQSGILVLFTCTTLSIHTASYTGAYSSSFDLLDVDMSALDQRKSKPYSTFRSPYGFSNLRKDRDSGDLITETFLLPELKYQIWMIRQRAPLTRAEV